MRRDIISLLIVLLLIGIGYYRFKNTIYKHNYTQFKMDTIVELTLESKSKDVKTIADSAFDLFDRYEKILSYYKENSELQKINNAEEDTILVSSEIIEILKIAKQYYEISDGKYDVSIGTLTDCWDFDQEIIPSEEKIIDAKQFIGFDKIIILEDRIVKPIGMKINLGSIAKGYIVDKVSEYLQNNGIENGVVNAGGDIRLFGARDEKLRIGVQHPRERSEIIERINLGTGAIVTSGDYERFFIKDGVRFHHIIDPITGFPTTNLISVTIIAPTAIEADAISTACFLKTPNEAITMIKKIDNVAGIVYFIENEEIISYKTENIKEYMNYEK